MRGIQVSHIHISAPCRPMRLALVSDLHKGRLDEVVDLLLSHIVPDAVLIAGDLFETPPRRRRSSCERGLALLRRISHMLPVFYATGNHDAEIPANVQLELAHLGVHMLHDSAVEWEGIHIGGLASAIFREDKQPNTAFLSEFAKEEGYKILLSHHPEYFPTYIEQLPIDITLSGHAHGGQWRIAGQGVYAPDQGMFPRYSRGIYHDGRLIVSAGIGDCVWVPRINNPHEIVVLYLENETKGQS